MSNVKFVSFILIMLTANSMLMAQKYTLRTREQILDKRYHTSIYSYSYDEYANIAMASKEYFYLANKFLDKKDYENALKNYEIALSMYDWGAFYYQYGVCFMNMEDYENAEKSFFKAIEKIGWEDPYNIIAPYYSKNGRNPIYSFDNNGIVRERYFSYYNLACIYSLQNKLAECRRYIQLALEFGYPYLNYIFSDVDLANLFNSPLSSQAKEEINKIYNTGFVNTVSGKYYEYFDGGSDSWDYEFTDNSHVKLHLTTSDDRNHVLHGTYTIKNYHVIIKYNRATGEKGKNPIGSGGVNTIYDTYIPYDRAINETEFISLKEKEMAGEDRWKQIK